MTTKFINWIVIAFYLFRKLSIVSCADFLFYSLRIIRISSLWFYSIPFGTDRNVALLKNKKIKNRIIHLSQPLCVPEIRRSLFVLTLKGTTAIATKCVVAVSDVSLFLLFSCSVYQRRLNLTIDNLPGKIMFGPYQERI